MKKLFSILLLFILTITTTFGNFEINTTLTKSQQKIIVDKIDKIYLTFEKGLDALSLETRVSSLEIIVDNVDKMLEKEKKEIAKFVISYLRYLIANSLNLAKKDLENAKSIENPKETEVTKEEEKTETTISLLPDNELNQTLFLAGSKDNKILSFKIKAEYDNIRLKDLVFTGNGLDNLYNFRILSPSGTQIPATSTTSNKIVFSGINENSSDIIKRDTTRVYNLIADINSGINGKTFNVVLNANDSKILFSTGRTGIVSGNNVESKIYSIVNNSVIIQKAENTGKNIMTSALRFNVTAFGKDGITLTKATFKNTFSGYDITNAKLSVYKNSATNFNLLGSTSLGIVSGDVILNQNNSIDSGYTNNYVVVIDGITYDSNAKNQDWVISMTDLETSTGIHLSDYANTGEFPFVEVK